MDSALMTPDLLAPGDGKSVRLDPAQLTWSRIRSCDDPLFERAYTALWTEFGAGHEMEAREVLAGRLMADRSIRYEIIVALSGGTIAAIRDLSAIWFEGEVVVHLSHLLVAPEWRRSGLAGWMRAVAALAGRAMAAAHGHPEAAVTLAGEMEYDDGNDSRRRVRLTAYEHAGFKKIDPRAVHYFQPDFRAPAEIDATGGARPLPFQLIVRRVGREAESTITGAGVRRLVRALYSIYALQFRPQDMAHRSLSLDHYPNDDAEIALIPPTA